MLRQFEITCSTNSSVQRDCILSTYRCICICIPCYPLGQSGWFFAPSFGGAGIFRLSFSWVPQLDTNPFHMMAAGVLGAALLCAEQRRTYTLFEDGDGSNTFHLTQLKLKRLTQW